MKIIKVVTGFLEENCYILIKGNNALVIDPGDDYELIKKEIGTNNVLAVLITHHHFDHIGALESLLKDYPVDIIDYKSKKNQSIKNFSFKIIPTSGHTSDSVSFYFEQDKVIFTGDFLFRNSIGRTDLDSGNQIEMEKSISNIKKYDRDVKLYPGHGEETTLSHEIDYNIYMR